MSLGKHGIGRAGQHPSSELDPLHGRVGRAGCPMLEPQLPRHRTRLAASIAAGRPAQPISITAAAAVDAVDAVVSSERSSFLQASVVRRIVGPACVHPRR